MYMRKLIGYAAELKDRRLRRTEPVHFTSLRDAFAWIRQQRAEGNVYPIWKHADGTIHLGILPVDRRGRPNV